VLVRIAFLSYGCCWRPLLMLMLMLMLMLRYSIWQRLHRRLHLSMLLRWHRYTEMSVWQLPIMDIYWNGSSQCWQSKRKAPQKTTILLQRQLSRRRQSDHHQRNEGKPRSTCDSDQSHQQQGVSQNSRQSAHLAITKAFALHRLQLWMTIIIYFSVQRGMYHVCITNQILILEFSWEV
jgi:hypothetical protein